MYFKYFLNSYKSQLTIFSYILLSHLHFLLVQINEDDRLVFEKPTAFFETTPLYIKKVK